MDYIFTHYGKLRVKNTASDTSSVAVTAFVTDDTKIYVRNHNLLFGLSYYFCNAPCYSDVCACEECPNFCGFYLAGALGGSLLDCRVKSTSQGDSVIIGIPSVTTQPVRIASHIGDTSFTSTIYAGYGYREMSLYIGAEAFATYADLFRRQEDFVRVDIAGSNPVFTTFDTKPRIWPWQFGVQFRPGFVITPSTLLYGVLGTSYARIEAVSDATIVDARLPISASLHNSRKSGRATFRAGVGLEYAFCRCWNLRADYLYTDYGSLRLTKTVTNTVDGLSADLIERIRIHFHTHAITLGAARYF